MVSSRGIWAPEVANSTIGLHRPRGLWAVPSHELGHLVLSWIMVSPDGNVQTRAKIRRDTTGLSKAIVRGLLRESGQPTLLLPDMSARRSGDRGTCP